MDLKNFQVQAVKGLRYLLKMVNALVNQAILFFAEYILCVLLTGVISSSLFHSRLNAWGAGLGVYAVGILHRYFGTPKPGKGQQVQLVMQPLDLGGLDAHVHEHQGDDGAGKGSGPYL